MLQSCIGKNKPGNKARADERGGELMNARTAQTAKAAPAVPGGCCTAGPALRLPWCGQQQAAACTKGLPPTQTAAETQFNHDSHLGKIIK